MKKTPLYEAHLRLGARMVDFAGYLLPLQYTSIVEEHLAVRRAAGVFDVSHMGEFLVRGEEALAFLQWATVNDAGKLKVGRAQYSMLPNERGGVVDDIYLYRLGEEEYLMVVNAANIAKDLAHLQALAKGFRVELEGGEVLEADRVLVAVGRRPYTEGLSLENAGLSTDERGRIPVDEHLRTRVPHIYAIGDVVRGPMLAHKASEEGIAAVEHMARGFGHVDYQAIPSVVYTHPEIAAVGYTEEELKAQGIPYKVGKFPYSASGRARAMGETEGFIKVLAHAKTDRILGVHGIGARVGDVLAEAALALFFKASAEDLGRAPHAHPSLSEILKEAALAAWERPIHL